MLLLGVMQRRGVFTPVDWTFVVVLSALVVMIVLIGLFGQP